LYRSEVELLLKQNVYKNGTWKISAALWREGLRCQNLRGSFPVRKKQNKLKSIFSCNYFPRQSVDFPLKIRGKVIRAEKKL
jgi:hypothetical protein